MSYEGYSQFLCKNGHESLRDCYEDDLIICPKCNEQIVWSNMVDTTNGSYDEEGNQIDGYVDLKIKEQKCCSCCNNILETIYEIPEINRRENEI